MSTKDQFNGNTNLTINANQLAGQTAIGGASNIINLFGSDIWEFDWAYLGRDGVAYQFPQIKNNKAEYHHTTAMKVNNEGFHEVDSFEKFNAICSTYNGISYPGDGWFNLTTDVNYSNTTYAVKSEFSGKLYGNGHSASNIEISSKNSENLGFFGVIQGTAEITEFGIINCRVISTKDSSNSSVGAFAGFISHGATIVNCYVQNGYVEGLNNLGGFAGAIAITGRDGNGKVEGCRVINVQVKHGQDYQDTTSYGGPTGGFVGWTNNANISSSYYMHSDTTGGKDGSSVWGLLFMGGFVGKTEGFTTIDNSFSYGSIWCNRRLRVTLKENRETIGGFVGVNTSSSVSITNCYARVTITRNGGVTNSKSTKGFGHNTGGGTFSNNYCLSGQNYNASGGAGAIEKSESELKIQSTFSGWDFSNVWTMSSTAEMPFGMPVPKKALVDAQETWNLRVKTDGNSIIQVYNGTTLVKQSTSSSSGTGYISRIPTGNYQIYIIRNGQKVLDSSTVLSYASYNIEKFELNISEANQVYDLQTEKWFTNGSGTENDPYIISTFNEFEKLNNFDGFGEGTHFALYNNLDLNNQEINGVNNFKGVFDGRNHIISNFKLNSSSTNLGLFKNTINATIKNLGVQNFNLTSMASESYYSGALVGKAENSSIISCFADHGFLNVNVNAGSLIGLLSGGNAMYSYSTNNVTSIVSNGVSVSNLGGFIGKATGASTIEECYSDGSVAGSRLIGGFVAEADDTTIKNTYTRVYVTTDYNGRDNPEVGGYAGIISAAAKIENSFMFGTISTDLTTAGNFAGVNSSENLVNVYYWNNNSLEGIGKNNASVAAKPLSTTEFNQASSFEEYDFIEIWGMPSESSAVTGAPVLRRVVNAFEINEKILGKGTEQDPYIIFDEKTLLEVADLVNANPGKVLYFKVQKNIELSSSNWVGLGTETKPFTGVFDGNNKTISGLKFSGESAFAVGLFAYAKDATIKNLNIINPLIETSSTIDAGAIVGKGSNLKFENVSVSSGSISSAGNSGALAGNIEKGNVKNSSASGINISGENGGLVGKATNVEFFNCQTSGISVSATQNAGSIVGLLENGIIHNLSVGVNTLNAPNVGGIAGTIINSKIKSVFVSNSNASGASYLGGAVGIANSSSIIGVNVILSGSLSATTSVGALVGKANGSTLNNNTVNTRWGASTSTLSAVNVGGLVGEAENMIQLKENRMCKLVLSPSSSSGYVGQLYGKLTGNSNASKTLYASIEISNSVGATSNALSGTSKTETDTNESGAIERTTWTYVE